MSLALHIGTGIDEQPQRVRVTTSSGANQSSVAALNAGQRRHDQGEEDGGGIANNLNNC